MNIKKIQRRIGFIFLVTALVLFSSGLAAAAINTEGENKGNDLTVTADSIVTDENARILAREGAAEYYWRVEGDSSVLYSINNSDVKQLAVFPPDINSIGHDLNYIVDFGICGDWIILSVGRHEGTMQNFFGDFVRLKKDGSDLEHFWLTNGDSFTVADDWIYYDSWTFDEKEIEGICRIRPDGTGKEYMGEIFGAVYLYAEDGYLYGSHDNGKPINAWNSVADLVRCKPDGSGMITLFSGDVLPKFDDVNFMSYSDVAVGDGIVTFNVRLQGYADGDSWYGHLCYTADYRVNKDGSNLTLLREEYPESEKQAEGN